MSSKSLWNFLSPRFATYLIRWNGWNSQKYFGEKCAISIIPIISIIYIYNTYNVYICTVAHLHFVLDILLGTLSNRRCLLKNAHCPLNFPDQNTHTSRNVEIYKMFQERISRVPSKEKAEEGDLESQNQKFFSEVWFSSWFSLKRELKLVNGNYTSLRNKDLRPRSNW